MIDDPLLNSLIDYAATSCAIYIFVVGVGRLAMMNWKTHRRIWQIVYMLLVWWAAGNVLLVLDGTGHGMAFLGMLATCIWFYESRNRWRDKPPSYMERVWNSN